MNIDEYKEKALRTNLSEDQYDESVARLISDGTASPYSTATTLHAAFGIVTEAGEIMDHLKRSFFYGGHRMNYTHLAEEVGDLLWYMNLLVSVIEKETGKGFEEIMAANIAKLMVRYPSKFNTEDALNRDLEAEGKALKSGLYNE